MKINFTYYLFFLFFSIKIFAQDPIQDTISPVVKNDTIFNAPQETIIFPKTYWNIGNEKRYNVTTSEVKLEDDTISHQEQYTYNVIIQVENVYQNETIVKWNFRNVQFNSKSFLNNPFSLVNNVSISFKIDQDGRFLGYTDLDKTIKQLVLSSEDLENKYLDNPTAIALIKKNLQQYSTEENIVKLFDKDIRQFHHFYGKSNFTLESAPLVYQSYMDNLFSTSPTPATTELKLNEIGVSQTNYIMSSFQEADKDWLANSWYSYLKDLATKLGSEQPSEKRLKDDIKYYVKTTSRIKDNGWISYSIETKKVKFQDTDYTLERRFELVD
ncbi:MULTISPECIES: hypothetical protein [Empedobacter]|uniref:Uncharacterized protein n=1 Tax=Empedobacter falsenii TaxID=343874 RepID=A0A7H9DQN7_9FLAO|nr:MULTISPECIES: hypothetical protein [Empedobacter]MDH2208481.1 hypothetical protein [Empedobacter sp. GD03644]QLL57424.1 hypothetical protein FH779_04720 [Empedobacter falsenii]